MLDRVIPADWQAWVGPSLAMFGAVVAALALHAVVYFIARRVTDRTEGVADTSLVSHTRRAVQLVAVALAIRLTVTLLPLDEASMATVRHVVGILVIGALTWAAIRAMSVIDDVILARHRLDVADNLAARKIYTQTKVLSRTAVAVVSIVGVAAALMTFPAIRHLGMSLLASAGIAGIVVGMAARPTIGSFIAGIQLALTQPIRIDDVVIVEGEWGRVEEITPTYVVIRIWDERRLVVPLTYFIEQPFQNWTRRTADITGSVFLYADYTIPVEAVRAELKRIVEDEASELWDRKVCVLQVTDATERTVQLRALVSASSSSAAWDLRCLVREKLLRYIQERHPHSLPRARTELEAPRAPGEA